MESAGRRKIDGGGMKGETLGALSMDSRWLMLAVAGILKHPRLRLV